MEVHKIKFNRMFPLFLIIAFIIIVAATFITVSSKNPSKKNGSITNVQSEEGEKEGDKQLLAVLKEINTDQETMTFIDIDRSEEITLAYTGGTDITDKYNQVIAATQLTLGEMVDVSYTTVKNKMVKLQISNRAWEYQGVKNWSIDQTKGIFQIADQNYKYSSNLLLLRKGEMLDIQDLDDKDEFTVKGYKKEIYSIIVTKGHGTIILEDYDDFIGGTIYIGNSVIVPVISDQHITVQEGSYEVTMENGSLKGVKQVTVEADKELILNMGDFKKPVIQKGKVTFNITPKGADLYIDEVLCTYKDPIELEYGNHAITVTLGGYTTYTGELEVKGSKESISIDLVESQNTTDAEEDNNTADTDSSNTSNTEEENNSSSNSNSTDNDTTESTTETTQDDTTKYIYIKQPEEASVYFDGQFEGTVPVSFPKKVGSHYITLIKSGYRTETNTVVIKDDGKDTTLSFDMTKLN